MTFGSFFEKRAERLVVRKLKRKGRQLSRTLSGGPLNETPLPVAVIHWTGLECLTTFQR
jgi:hypothetical protein